MQLVKTIYKKITLQKVCVFFFALLILLRLIFLFIPFDRDEGSYAYIGWQWLTGHGIPYLSAFDQKPPLPYILYGLGYFLTPGTFFGLRIIAFISFLITIYLFYFFIYQLSRKIEISILLALVVGFFYSSIQLEGNGFNTEIEMVLPLLLFVILLWYIVEKRSKNIYLLLTVGILGGITVFFKPVGALPVGILCLWYFFYKKDILGFFLIVVGGLATLFITLAYFYLNHALSYFIQDVWIYNRAYVRAGLQLSDIYIRGGATGPIGFLKWLLLTPDVLKPFMIFALLSLVFTCKKRTSIWWMSLLSILTLWIAVKTGGREFPHYYLLLPFVLGLASLIGIQELYRNGFGFVAKAMMIFLLLQVILPEMPTNVQGTTAIQFSQYGTQTAWFVDAKQVGDYLKSHFAKDNVFVWANEPEIYYYAQKKSITPFINLYAFYYFQNEQKQWLAYLMKHPPTIIVTYYDDPANKDVAAFFKRKKGYRQIKIIATSYRIYKYMPSL